MSISALVSKQNPDGGWPYVRGGSWTEPTVYAVMALLAAGETEPAKRGLHWICAARRPDGGWPPRVEIEESTWVTGLVALLPPADLGPEMHDRAIGWLLGTQGKETTRAYQLREWLLGVPRSPEQMFPGWPWVPRYGRVGWPYLNRHSGTEEGRSTAEHRQDPRAHPGRAGVSAGPDV